MCWGGLRSPSAFRVAVLMQSPGRCVVWQKPDRPPATPHTHTIACSKSSRRTRRRKTVIVSSQSPPSRIQRTLCPTNNPVRTVIFEDLINSVLN